MKLNVAGVKLVLRSDPKAPRSRYIATSFWPCMTPERAKSPASYSTVMVIGEPVASERVSVPLAKFLTTELMGMGAS